MKLWLGILAYFPTKKRPWAKYDSYWKFNLNLEFCSHNIMVHEEYSKNILLNFREYSRVSPIYWLIRKNPSNKMFKLSREQFFWLKLQRNWSWVLLVGYFCPHCPVHLLPETSSSTILLFFAIRKIWQSNS